MRLSFEHFPFHFTRRAAFEAGFTAVVVQHPAVEQEKIGWFTAREQPHLKITVQCAKSGEIAGVERIKGFDEARQREPLSQE